jgi:hypothetical protein
MTPRFQQAVTRLVAEALATQPQARDAELEARINALLDARLKQQRAELVRLVNQLNREQRLQLAAWIRESEPRSSPDLLDLVSTFPWLRGEMNNRSRPPSTPCRPYWMAQPDCGEWLTGRQV